MTAKKKMSEGKLYLRLIRMNLLAGLQYKGWPMSIFVTLFSVITDPLSTVFLFSRFGGIGEWSMERILLIYSMAVTSFGLAETFCRGFDYFPWQMVQNGEFDRVLLRPRSTFVQVAASRFHIHRLARVFTGLLASIWCLWSLRVPAEPWRILLFLAALAGGLLMYSGVFVLTSGISFYTIKGNDWIYVLTNAGYQVTRCPIEYVPTALRLAFTFLLPVFVISYYPASVCCGWGEPLWKGLLALPAGFAFLLASQAVWRVGVRRYNSTGS